jgi:Arc/MetJ-type ribon-helix-helix transcriptional regulator
MGMKIVSCNITQKQKAAIENLVDLELYSSRSEVFRIAIRRFLLHNRKYLKDTLQTTSVPLEININKYKIIKDLEGLKIGGD